MTAGLLTAGLLLGLVEADLRLAGYRHVPRQKLLYVPKTTGFAGTTQFFIGTFLSPPGYLWITEPNTEYTDPFGFRTPGAPFDRTDKTRVAFLGGSTTQGGYRPYPERAIRLLNEALGEERYEAVNAACSSYSTHQSRLLFDRVVAGMKPDVLVVYHGWNDVLVAGDGYSDAEKDRIVTLGNGPSMAPSPWLSNLRITQAAAQLAESADLTWPRQRVSFDAFEDNLDYLARQCAKNGIRMIVMVRPSQAADELKFAPLDANTPTGRAAVRDYGTTDPVSVYTQSAARVTAIQRRVAERHPQVVVAFDAASLFTDLNAQRQSGKFGDQVRLFRQDAIHLTDFGDELLARHIALAIAPEHGVAVSNYLHATPYLRARAREFLKECHPRESVWFIQQGLALHDTDFGKTPWLDLLARAESDFDFADAFHDACMGGRETNAQRRIDLLSDCLRQRPRDYGVMQQLYMTCFSTGRGTEAAAALSAFRTEHTSQRRDWLMFTLESHIEARREQEAREVSAALLAIDPGNELVRDLFGGSP